LEQSRKDNLLNHKDPSLGCLRSCQFHSCKKRLEEDLESEVESMIPRKNYHFFLKNIITDMIVKCHATQSRN
jgi:hypothetical protein